MDAEHGAVVEHLVADALAGLDRADPRAAGRPDLDVDAVLGAVPDLHLVLGHVGDLVADHDPAELVAQAGGGERPAGVDAADHERAVGRLSVGSTWPALPAATDTQRPRRRQRVVDPARHRARRVVGVAVGAEADVDRDRQRLLVRRRARPPAPAGSRPRRRCGWSRRSSTTPPWSSGRSATSTPARWARRATPRLPAAIEATWVPCEPATIADCGSRLVAAMLPPGRGGDRGVHVRLADLRRRSRGSGTGCPRARPARARGGRCRPGPRSPPSGCPRRRRSPRARSRSRRRR